LLVIFSRESGESTYWFAEIRDLGMVWDAGRGQRRRGERGWKFDSREKTYGETEHNGMRVVVAEGS